MNDRFFFSYQPFWNCSSLLSLGSFYEANKDNLLFRICILYDWRGRPTLNIPGTGSVSLTFPLGDKQRPQCDGVGSRRDFTPQFNETPRVIVQFAAGEFYRLLGVPCDDLPHDSTWTLPMEALFAREAVEKTWEAVANADDPACQRDIVLDFIVKQCARGERVRKGENCNLTQYLVGEIFSSKGGVQVGELAKKTGYSERYINATLLKQIGLTPKQFCRQVRFQSALNQLTQDRTRSLSDLAYSLGFSDQAHLSHEFKGFCGLTPGQYRERLTRSAPLLVSSSWHRTMPAIDG